MLLAINPTHLTLIQFFFSLNFYRRRPLVYPNSETQTRTRSQPNATSYFFPLNNRTTTDFFSITQVNLRNCTFTTSTTKSRERGEFLLWKNFFSSTAAPPSRQHLSPSSFYPSPAPIPLFPPSLLSPPPLSPDPDPGEHAATPHSDYPAGIVTAP